MLVLSRGTQEAIIFPALGITVRVLKLNQKLVKLGIEAPAHIEAFRNELLPSCPTATPAALSRTKVAEQHRIGNRLNTAALSIHLVQEYLIRGKNDQAASMLHRALDELQRVETMLGNGNDGQSVDTPELPIRALIAEDDANERELLAGMLRLQGWQVDVVSDGDEVLPYLSCHSLPHLLLIDLLMPRCNGSETIRLLRRACDYNSMKIAVVSGTDPHQLGLDVGSQGVDVWFAKPLNPAQMLRTIESLLLPTRV